MLEECESTNTWFGGRHGNAIVGDGEREGGMEEMKMPIPVIGSNQEGMSGTHMSSYGWMYGTTRAKVGS